MERQDAGSEEGFVAQKPCDRQEDLTSRTPFGITGPLLAKLPGDMGDYAKAD